MDGREKGGRVGALWVVALSWERGSDVGVQKVSCLVFVVWNDGVLSFL